MHQDLDPKGVKFRESRDSTEHPTSLAIAVLFDVTGSMSTIPRVLQTKLPQLFGVLQQRNYVEHPQILFGGIGDATCDRVPLQVAQFESDNRMDDQLEQIFLESGGGGQKTESYELALYFMARHTSIDCLDVRNHKGYLFMIGDEMPYASVDHRQVQNLIDDGLQGPVTFEDILAEAQRMYEVYYILPSYAHHGDDKEVIDFWKGHLGDHFLTLDDPDEICDLIGTTVAVMERYGATPKKP